MTHILFPSPIQDCQSKLEEMAVVLAQGSPSRWLRREVESGRWDAQISVADKQRICNLLSQLTHRDADVGKQAAETLDCMAKGPLAHAVASALTMPLANLHIPVKSTLLSALRCLAESGHASAVSSHAHHVADCLKDEDASIQRKAATLLRVLSEEGASATVAMHAKKLLECFQASGSSLVAPLEALHALVDHGEPAVVASLAMELMEGLKHMRSAIRMEACNTFRSMSQAGGVELLRRFGLLDAPAEADVGRTAYSSTSLLDVLMRLVLEDTDRKIQLLAAHTLKEIVDLDLASQEMLRDKHSFTLFQSIRNQRSTLDRDIRFILAEILGIDLVQAGNQTQELKQGCVDETGDELRESIGECVICLSDIFGEDASSALPCGHGAVHFHARCITEWLVLQGKFGKRSTCPLCRASADPQEKVGSANLSSASYAERRHGIPARNSRVQSSMSGASSTFRNSASRRTRSSAQASPARGRIRR
eukprot:TRINITY_DN46333_c0_g1_i1.p1 TRINITY_DN46333_c0_g1~~TRINITY_DN46333_c0_g1_i1.p1  ORF type:complete len:480 (+),score=88.60 TRINITY_DN46333_c0_g1_i1:16-1455(+)